MSVLFTGGTGSGRDIGVEGQQGAVTDNKVRYRCNEMRRVVRWQATVKWLDMRKQYM